MLKILQRRLALSEKGAKDFLKGVFFTTLMDIALMLPAVYIFLFLEDYLRPLLSSSTSAASGIGYYILLGIGFMLIMFVVAVFQYKSTFTTVYDESANRRISLAEKLRKLPLAFLARKTCRT